jgi:hypothetical protein
MRKVKKPGNSECYTHRQKPHIPSSSTSFVRVINKDFIPSLFYYFTFYKIRNIKEMCVYCMEVYSHIFEDPYVSGVSVVPTSYVRTSALWLLLFIGK